MNKVFLQKSFFSLIVLFSALLMSSCSKDIVFPASEVVPAAVAILKIDENSNGNYDLKLAVENLATPDRLSPARKYYVAWLVTKKNGTINIGKLRVNRKNKADLETVTPYEPIRVFITAEDGDEVVLPSTQVVLDSRKFKL